MGKSIWSIARTVGLVVMIVCAAIATVWLFLLGQIWWGAFWSVIIATVGVFEIAAYAKDHETISTKYKKFIQAHPVAGRVIIYILALALLGLWVHLLVW